MNNPLAHSQARPDSEQPLADCFARYHGREFLFVEPTGNWGDSLIYLGAEALARRLGLRWSRVTVDRFVELPPDSTKVIYIHGGGGFNPWCSGKALLAFSHAVSYYPGPVINGPMTVDDDGGYVEKVMLKALHHVAAREVIVYVRERTSLATLSGRLPSGMELRLDHDTALQLTPEEALRGTSQRSRYTLFALRQDNEAPGEGDATQFDGVLLDPAMYARSFDHWVRIHALARRIVTNRTHSSVLGAVLGKPTTLLGGSYHKNRSIWEYSLRSRGVDWLDWDSAPVASEKPRTTVFDFPLAQRIARSWKVQRTMNRLRKVPWA